MEKYSFFTVDVEEDFEGVGYSKQEGHRNPDEVLRLLSKACAIFERRAARATLFFVVNAIKGQDVKIRELSNKGHEIALHGLDHVPLDLQTPQSFKRSLVEAKKKLEDIVGKAVLGFRAPTWSLRSESAWAVEMLQEAGFIYSSSLFPRSMGLYGNSSYPTSPFRYKKSALVEIPAQIGDIFGMRFPYFGGAYLRALPAKMIQFLFTADQNPLRMLYVHPWELKNERSAHFVSNISAFIGKIGLKTTEKKLDLAADLLLKYAKPMTLAEFVTAFKTFPEIDPFELEQS